MVFYSSPATICILAIKFFAYNGYIKRKSFFIDIGGLGGNVIWAVRKILFYFLQAFSRYPYICSRFVYIAHIFYNIKHLDLLRILVFLFQN